MVKSFSSFIFKPIANISANSKAVKPISSVGSESWKEIEKELSFKLIT